MQAVKLWTMHRNEWVRMSVEDRMLFQICNNYWRDTEHKQPWDTNASQDSLVWLGYKKMHGSEIHWNSWARCGNSWAKYRNSWAKCEFALSFAGYTDCVDACCVMNASISSSSCWAAEKSKNIIDHSFDFALRSSEIVPRLFLTSTSSILVLLMRAALNQIHRSYSLVNACFFSHASGYQHWATKLWIIVLCWIQ